MKRQGFAKCEHLLAKKDFDATYALRRSARDGRLVLYARPNALKHSRLGMSVAKRYGNSVRRNRFRRLIREAFRLHKEELPKGCDFIVIPGRGLDVSLDDIAQSLLTLAKKLCAPQA